MLTTTAEIRTAEAFFRNSPVAVLENQAKEFNSEQPSFIAVVLAMEKLGLSREKAEDLLESIFVVYYVQRVLHKKRINDITTGQIARNIASFQSFLTYYNAEKRFSDDVDLSKVRFLKDETVLAYAVQTLANLFGKPSAMPNEVVLPYFALLKAIEAGAEKAG